MSCAEGVQKLAGQKILVTGSSGFLAYSLLGMLRDVDCRIYGLLRPGSSGPFFEGMAKLETLTGDIRERATWEQFLEGIDVIFHLAAQTSSVISDQDPAADFEANVRPLLSLLEICRLKKWRPVVIFASTVTIAGLPQRCPVDETFPDDPLTVYDLHKMKAEEQLKQGIGRNVVRGAILRLANVYGPGPRSSQPDRGVLNLMIHKALAGEGLTLFGKGDRLRDYVFVRDVAQAFLDAASHIERVNGRHFVIGSGQGHTVAEAVRLVAERVARKTGKKVSVTQVDSPRDRPRIEDRNFVADPHQFQEATGWHPRFSLTEGIDRTIDAFLNVEKSGQG